MGIESVKPELSVPFPSIPETWTCPITGLVVPKDPRANLEWRARLLREAEQDPDMQEALMSACSQSILFWVNAFAFTFRVFDQDASGKRRQASNAHLPYVTWAIQDQHILEIEKAIDDGYDLLTDKTRDMGASWDHVVVFHHQWLFKAGRLFLEMSRIEDDVDGAKNPKCLFVKHDYINQWLPEWMLPAIERTKMHIVNLDNGSRIDGESSNKAAGSGDRRHAILMDEFAKMENAEKIKSSTADVAPCRLPNSTPWGPGTAYSKWRMSGKIRVFEMPWYEHPEKGLGRYTHLDEITNKWSIRSPWYDLETSKRSPKEMAQEIDRDHVGSGDTFFEAQRIVEHRALFSRPAISFRCIDFKETIAHSSIPDILLRKQREALNLSGANGPLRLWVHLIGGRLDQTKTYILGIDISKGQGASNSVISIYCRETGEKVGEYADANVPPHDFARVACAVALWVGGASHGGLPLVIWENNGDPGWNFGREFVKTFKYPNYYVDRTVGKAIETANKKYGWHSSPDKKKLLLGGLRRAYAHGGFINHSAEALDEALVYIEFPDGEIGPAALMEESASARKTHGDRVIADALCLWALEGGPRAKTQEIKAPNRSIGHRMATWKKNKLNAASGKQFDFRGVADAD